MAAPLWSVPGHRDTRSRFTAQGVCSQHRPILEAPPTTNPKALDPEGSCLMSCALLLLYYLLYYSKVLVLCNYHWPSRRRPGRRTSTAPRCVYGPHLTGFPHGRLWPFLMLSLKVFWRRIRISLACFSLVWGLRLYLL